MIEPSGRTACSMPVGVSISRFHASGEVLHDLLKFHVSQSIGGRVGPDAGSDPLVTSSWRHSGSHDDAPMALSNRRPIKAGPPVPCRFEPLIEGPPVACA
jgi:hypothetical protein